MICVYCGETMKPNPKKTGDIFADSLGINICDECIKMEIKTFRTQSEKRASLLYPNGTVKLKTYYHQAEFQDWHTGMPVPNFEIPKDATQARGSILGVQFKDGKMMMMFKIDVIIAENGTFERWL